MCCKHTVCLAKVERPLECCHNDTSSCSMWLSSRQDDPSISCAFIPSVSDFLVCILCVCVRLCVHAFARMYVCLTGVLPGHCQESVSGTLSICFKPAARPAGSASWMPSWLHVVTNQHTLHRRACGTSICSNCGRGKNV